SLPVTLSIRFWPADLAVPNTRHHPNKPVFNPLRGAPMRSAYLQIATMLIASVVPVSGSAAQAAASPDAASGVASLTQTATRFENNIVSLAEAMPADKYDFAPSKEIFKPGSPAEFATVHTFAQQVTHLCALPYRVFAPFGVKP